MSKNNDNMKWVSVKDRLPEEVTPVLVYEVCCGCEYFEIAEVENGEWWLTGDGGEPTLAPTHWTELPKPPKP